ncbi:MAG: MFS transporter [Alphaproteobacteria bacterium]|nr:MFS transporter [Alphaproteobacteria bacterium]
MGDAVFAKAAWRIIPFMMLLYVANFLDRVNVGFAALTMNRDLGIDATAFGIVGGTFFLGYFLFEVPSNVVLEKVGARRWIFRIMLTWGLVSMATAFAQGVQSLSAMRFLLGVAEAGFFPGIVFYLSLWFPAELRARMVGFFLCSISLANIVGAPLSGWVLGFDGLGGLHGWQWLFLIEGAPSVLLAFAVLFYLPDGPETASWLSEGDRAAIEAGVAAEPSHIHHSFWTMIGDARVWALALPDFGIVLSTYGLGLWLPQIVKGLSFSNFDTGVAVGLVYVASSVVSVLWCLSSDRSGERVRHVAVAAVIGACGLFAAAFLQGTIWCVAALGVAMAGTLAAISVFWALPSSFLRGTAAAGGIALINSLANLGGFAGPYLMGGLKTWSGGYSLGFVALGLGLVMTAATILLLGRSLGFARRAQRFDKFAPPV